MGLELTTGRIPQKASPEEARAAAVHIADRAAAAHPHALDEDMPRLAGRLTAREPGVTAGVLELLDALGIDRTQAGRQP